MSLTNEVLNREFYRHKSNTVRRGLAENGF